MYGTCRIANYNTYEESKVNLIGMSAGFMTFKCFSYHMPRHFLLLQMTTCQLQQSLDFQSHLILRHLMSINYGTLHNVFHFTPFHIKNEDFGPKLGKNEICHGVFYHDINTLLFHIQQINDVQMRISYVILMTIMAIEPVNPIFTL